MEVNGTNYLIPVDAILERDIDVEDDTVPLDRVIHGREINSRRRPRDISTMRRVIE
jgi:hypothetical protein